MQGVASAADQVGSGASEIARGNADLSSRTEQQASALEQSAANVVELVNAIGAATENSRETRAITRSAYERSREFCRLAPRTRADYLKGLVDVRARYGSAPLGIINSHFSLLPRLRGADPITWSIANGDDKTGVSLMLIDTGMDTGKLLAQRSHRLDGSETTPTLTNDLIILSDSLIREYVPRYLDGDITPRAQPHPDRATYSRKLTKQDGVIDLSLPAEQIERRIRAFVDWPQSRTQIAGIDVIITGAHVSDTPTELSLQCGDGRYLAIDSLKPSGKKEMPARAFLAGYKNRI